MRDLTELKRAQAELQREHALIAGIVDTTRAIILRLDREGRIMSFNRYMEELSGYRLEEVKGKDWFTTFIPPREHERIRTVFASAIEGQRTQGNINPILTKDGEEVLVEWYDDLLDVPGEPHSLIAVGMDVTARDRLEREFLQAQKMEAVGRLAGGVAHDFNNLLAGILGGLRIASSDLAADHPSRQVLDEVRQEVERGSAITRRLLDFSRVGRTSPGLIDPRETLSSSERLIRRFIGEDVEMHCGDDSSRSRIFADPGQIEQAILNLAINARDAMPNGGKLDIHCSDVDFSTVELANLGAALEPGPYVVLSVEDSGCGMDEGTRTRALEAFFTTKDPGQGTGLGLSSVATMMEHAGGHLALESEVDVGTKVRLIFPRASVADVLKTAPRSTEEVPRGVAVPGDEVAAQEPEVAAEPRQTGATILLVEDETLVRLGVQHMLQEKGYVVLAAKDPETAQELLETDGDACDLLLTDVVLPRMGGPELAAAATAKRPGLRVLFMSAFPTVELVAQGRIPAGTPTLEKPFTDEQMVERIRTALESAPAHLSESDM